MSKTDTGIGGARLTVVLLGDFRVTLDSEVVTGFRSDTARALLAYLAVHPGVAHRRDALAGLLWPEVPNANALRNLRVTLSRLRDAIHDREVTPAFLEITRSTIALPGNGACTVDVWDLREALEAVRLHDHAAAERCVTCATRLERVAELYRGEFFSGFSLDSAPFEAWVVTEREALHWEVLEALTSLTYYYEGQGDYEAAIGYARRQVALEPWREVAHRQWMRALALSGRRNAALAQYEACRQVLADELGVEPEAETVALYEEIRDGLGAPSEVSPVPVAPVVVPGGTVRAPAPAIQPGGSVLEPTEPERRLVTVLQAEICGSDVLLTRVDMEDWAAILSQLLRAARAEVLRFGGEIERHEDDQLIALFGVGAAHEDDPERAVLAALGMLDAFESRLAALATDTPDWREGLLALDLRAVVHTGDAIVTGDGANRPTVIGDAMSAVRRLLADVPPGEIRTSDATYRLTAPLFEWAGGGEQGQPRHKPIGRKRSAGKGRGIPGMQSSLVGRDAEFVALQEALDRLQAANGGIVTLTGEAGIGKSRLVAEARAAQSGLCWIEGRCLSHSGATAYALWTSALRDVVGILPDTPPARASQALRAYLADLYDGGEGFDVAYPFLAYLLGASQDAKDQAMLAQMDAQALREAIFSTLTRLLEAMASREPLVIVCEDLHWADSLSLQLLERLLALPDRAPVLLLCAFRPERQHPCWRIRATAMRDYADRHMDLQLQPLSEADGDLLLRNLLLSIPGPQGRPSVEALPQGLKSEILMRGEGNPYYVEELLRSLIESEAIVCDEAACVWEAGADAAEVGIPDTLYGVLRGRIDRLSPRARHVAQLASVVGRVFSYRILAEIADRRGLNEALVILQREQLVRERAGASAPVYIFNHQLTREAIYGALLRRTRRALHRRVAEALERLYAGRLDEQLSHLAHHWEEAGETGSAIGYLRKAAERATVQYANEEALRYLGRALAMTRNNDLVSVYDLLSRRVQVYDHLGDRDAQWADIERLEHVAEALVSADVGSRRWLAEVALLKATYYEHTAGQPLQDQTVETAVQMAREIGDRDLEGRAQLAWGRAIAWQGDEPSAVQHWEASLRLAREVGNLQLEARSLRALGLTRDLFSAETTMGFLEQAHHIHQETGNRAEEGSILGALATVALDGHRPALSLAYGEKALQLCRATGLRREEGWAIVDMGMAWYALGRYVDSDRSLQDALAIFQEVADPIGESASIVMRARVAYRLGDRSTSVAYSRSALALADRVNAWEAGFAALMTLGEVSAALGEWRAARRAYSEAQSRCLRFEWPQQLIGVWAGLARVALAEGALNEAADIAQRILRYAEGDPDLHATADSMDIYLACHEVLVATGDQTADDVLRRAHGQLQARAVMIEDGDLRRSFLENVPSHRAIVAETQRRCLDVEKPAP